MQFEQNKTTEKYGERVGFTAAYILFSSCLCGLLYLVKKPLEVYYVIGITLLVVALGKLVQRYLK